MGGKPSRVRQFLYKHEIVSTSGHNSRKSILNGSRSYCTNLDTLKDIKFQDILDAYEYFYVPNYMTLIVTGDFETESLKNLIQQKFGMLTKNNVVRNIPYARDFDEGPASFSSSFKPLVDVSSHIGLAYRTNGYTSSDYYVLVVVAEYLKNQLYENIRVQEGLTYAPDVQLIESRKDGVIHLSAEVSTKHVDTVQKLMHDEVK